MQPTQIQLTPVSHNSIRGPMWVWRLTALFAYSGRWNFDLNPQSLPHLGSCFIPSSVRLLCVHILTFLKLGCHLELMLKEICHLLAGE